MLRSRQAGSAHGCFHPASAHVTTLNVALVPQVPCESAWLHPRGTDGCVPRGGCVKCVEWGVRRSCCVHARRWKEGRGGECEAPLFPNDFKFAFPNPVPYPVDDAGAWI